MNITVLNGSPKGEISVTMQYVRYLERRFPQHRFDVVHVARRIKTLERDRAAFDDVLRRVAECDVLLWDFPVYYLLVPSQLIRFVELIFERHGTAAFTDKYAAALSTSKHFYDHAAHNYLRAVCEDLGTRYVGFHSADMLDLRDQKQRAHLLRFGENLFRHATLGLPTTVEHPPVTGEAPRFDPGDVPHRPKGGRRNVLIVTDARDQDTNLHQMIDVFAKRLPNPAQVVNLSDVNLGNGCRGCMRCCEKGECVHRDGFRQFHERLIRADAVIYALRIGVRHFSSVYKRLLDRSFYNGHRHVTAGQCCAYIVSGPLARLPNVRQVARATAEINRAQCVGMVADDQGPSAQLVADLEQLGQQLLWRLDTGYEAPQTFLGVGGQLVFRDLVYNTGPFMKADYDYYRQHGLFDYPTNNLRKRLRNAAFAALMRIPPFRAEAYRNAGKYLIKPLQKALSAESQTLSWIGEGLTFGRSGAPA